jgi:hypothetical protein
MIKKEKEEWCWNIQSNQEKNRENPKMCNLNLIPKQDLKKNNWMTERTS